MQGTPKNQKEKDNHPNIKIHTVSKEAIYRRNPKANKTIKRCSKLLVRKCKLKQMSCHFIPINLDKTRKLNALVIYFLITVYPPNLAS